MPRPNDGYAPRSCVEARHSSKGISKAAGNGYDPRPHMARRFAGMPRPYNPFDEMIR